MNFTKKEIIAIILAIVPIIVVALFYNVLPSQIQTSWGFDGSITYSDKNHIWLITALPIIITALFKILSLIDPKKASSKKFGLEYSNIMLLLIIFLNILIAVNLFYSLVPVYSLY